MSDFGKYVGRVAEHSELCQDTLKKPREEDLKSIPCVEKWEGVRNLRSLGFKYLLCLSLAG